MRCAKSWQTPRRVSTTSVGEVLMVVTPGTYWMSACSFVLKPSAQARIGRPSGKHCAE